jgi:hypothetical protein
MSYALRTKLRLATTQLDIPMQRALMEGVGLWAEKHGIDISDTPEFGGNGKG